MERMSTMKSLDASMGAKMVGVDVNFTRFICNELQQDAEHRARLLPALSLLEKVKMSDFLDIISNLPTRNIIFAFHVYFFEFPFIWIRKSTNHLKMGGANDRTSSSGS